LVFGRGPRIERVDVKCIEGSIEQVNSFWAMGEMLKVRMKKILLNEKFLRNMVIILSIGLILLSVVKGLSSYRYRKALSQCGQHVHELERTIELQQQKLDKAEVQKRGRETGLNCGRDS